MLNEEACFTNLSRGCLVLRLGMVLNLAELCSVRSELISAIKVISYR